MLHCSGNLGEGSKRLLLDCEILIADPEQHVLRRFFVCSGQFSEGPTSPLPISFLS